MPSRNWFHTLTIYQKEGPAMPMCHTKVMRNALVVLICAFGFAQAPPPANSSAQEADAVIRTNVNVVIAPTAVRQRNGDLVNGLQLQDFQLYDNNKLQRVNA